jgi:hypothetical protein
LAVYGEPPTFLHPKKILVFCIFKGSFGDAAQPEINVSGTAPVEMSGFHQGADYAHRIGGMLVNWAAGPKSAGGGLFSASQAAGGQAHRFVYDVGKFFGKNFKPWEAVRYAKWVGNIGKALGAAGIVIRVVSEIHEETQQQEQRKKLAEHRNDIRVQFREMAKSVEDEFWSQFSEYERVQYESELEALRGMINQISTTRNNRSCEAKRFLSIAVKADELVRSLC